MENSNQAPTVDPNTGQRIKGAANYVTTDGVQLTAQPTGPLLQRADPRSSESGNVIKYLPKDQVGGADCYSANIPFGLDAIAAFELACKKMKFQGVSIRACALIVGGLRDTNSRQQGVHGGEVVAEWTPQSGFKGRADWRERVRGLPRPAVIATNRQSDVPRGT